MTSYVEIEDALRALGVTGRILGMDERYDLPTERWVGGAFATSFMDRLLALNIVYRADKSDCNTFALEAMAHARECHLKSDGKHQLAFGLIAYWTRNNICHAANVYATMAGADLEIHTFEPQTRQRTHLTDAEWKSTEWVLI